MSLSEQMDGPSESMGKSVRECKPDYQRLAAKLKEKMDANKEFSAALLKFKTSGYMDYHIKRQTFTLAELYGFLELNMAEWDKEYEKLLAEVEKEKADGSK